jgi:hypothetical protein
MSELYRLSQQNYQSGFYSHWSWHPSVTLQRDAVRNLHVYLMRFIERGQGLRSKKRVRERKGEN